MKPGQKLTREITGLLVCDWTKCPCGGELKVYEKTIVHTLPYCDHFLDDEPSAYIRWVRTSHAAN